MLVLNIAQVYPARLRKSKITRLASNNIRQKISEKISKNNARNNNRTLTQ